MNALDAAHRAYIVAQKSGDVKKIREALEALEVELRDAGYEKLDWPAMPRWQHPLRGGFYL